MDGQDGALSGRVALVTGASSGLGAGFALTLARAGARVAVAARREALLGDVVRRIEDAGGQAVAVAMDVTDAGSVERGFASVEDRLGPVDTVVANAGVSHAGAALDAGLDALEATFAVNVRGVFLTAREGARRMIASGVGAAEGGRIVLISSITATAVSPGTALYSASKAAVLQMGRVMAREWATKGVGVNILCPGYVGTELNSDWFASEGGKRQIGKWPRRRLMDDSALDSALLFLTSPASRHVTGSVVTVDDGQTLV